MIDKSLSSPTMVDVAKVAGVGVATVDRVINRRAPVKKATERKVLEAVKSIGYDISDKLGDDPDSASEAAVPHERRLGFLLLRRATPLYRFLAEALIDEAKSYHGERLTPVVEYLDTLDPERIAEAVLRLGRQVDALAVVSPDHPYVVQAIEQLGALGVPVFALLSNLSLRGHGAGYIGFDCRKVGRTAAWTIARMAGKPGKVGILTGSLRFQSQELFEISFRSYFRENAPSFRVLEPILSEEDPGIAKQAVSRLLAEELDLVGLYVGGGGIEGVIEALRERSHPGLVTVGHDLTSSTRAALIEGHLDLVMSLPRHELARRTVSAMLRSLQSGEGSLPAQIYQPFEIYISENI